LKKERASRHRNLDDMVADLERVARKMQAASGAGS